MERPKIEYQEITLYDKDLEINKPSIIEEINKLGAKGYEFSFQVDITWKNISFDEDEKYEVVGKRLFFKRPIL